MAVQRISGKQVRGIWPPLLLHWDAQWKLDEHAFEANLQRLIGLQPHGLYTLDTASEFYTLEFADWRSLAHRFVDGCRRYGAKMPIGLGCTWTHQEGALARIGEARDLGVQVIHLAPPYWLPLNDDGLVRFFAEVNRHAGHLGVVIYCPPWGKMTLTAALYRRLIAEAPCIIGTKTLGNDPELLQATEGHSHFVAEQSLLKAGRLGASGCYSALAGVSMKFMKDWWDEIERGDWVAVEARDKRVQQYYREGVQPIRDAGILAGAIDKSKAQIGGEVGSRLLRPPYPSVPDDLFAQLRRAAEKYILC